MSKKGSTVGGLKLMTGGLLSGPLGVSIDHVSSIGPCLSSTSTLAPDPNISIKPNPFFEKKKQHNECQQITIEFTMVRPQNGAGIVIEIAHTVWAPTYDSPRFLLLNLGLS